MQRSKKTGGTTVGSEISEIKIAVDKEYKETCLGY